MSRSMQCAAPGWNSGCTTGTGIPGARLSVFRPRGGLRFQRGDHDGRLFPSAEAASAFALQRGYSVVYRDAGLGTFKRVHRVALRAIMRRARAAVLAAPDGRAVVAAADAVKLEVLALGGDVLRPLAWSNGVYSMARRLRPGSLAS